MIRAHSRRAVNVQPRAREAGAVSVHPPAPRPRPAYFLQYVGLAGKHALDVHHLAQTGDLFIV